MLSTVSDNCIFPHFVQKKQQSPHFHCAKKKFLQPKGVQDSLLLVKLDK